MQLTLQKVIPQHLRDRLHTTQSGVWGVDITIEPRECVFVKAPSGAGKTTLLHILYGLRNDFTGIVKWGDIPPNTSDEETVAKLRRDNISIIFQDLRLFPNLTAWENIEAKRMLTNTVTEIQVMDWLERLGIANKMEALAATLSYGERQRVAIIRALVQPFQWLLMDEPFSHLDHANCAKAISLINEVVQQRRAGMLLADLDDNTHFSYSQTLIM